MQTILWGFCSGGSSEYQKNWRTTCCYRWKTLRRTGEAFCQVSLRCLACPRRRWLITLTGRRIEIEGALKILKNLLCFPSISSIALSNILKCLTRPVSNSPKSALGQGILLARKKVRSFWPSRAKRIASTRSSTSSTGISCLRCSCSFRRAWWPAKTSLFVDKSHLTS